MKARFMFCVCGLVFGVVGVFGEGIDPHRLEREVAPVTQSLELDLDPAKDGYSGVARVELNFQVATNQFRFHARELELGDAMLDGKKLTLKAGDANIVTATAEETIESGLHVFEIAFTNDFNRDGGGLYKAMARGKPYLFTQMEPLHARRAFPCWDEPSFKIPWRLTLTIPDDLEAVGNMAIAQTIAKDGKKRIEFGRTPPMPSYLMAMAVGPLEFVETRQSVPGRIVTSEGQAGLAKLAAEAAPPLLAALERYFMLPYPYPKLDHLAVPEFSSGAMENVGAITYRDSILLLDPSNVSYSQRSRLHNIIAHEMAHMWFGDLVTMAWWDDLWLNEAFATWMAFKIAGEVHPELRFDIQGYRRIAAARDADAQPSVKAIRRKFAGGADVREAFDVLSYNKGMAILRMVEGWLGEEKFRQALRRYFIKHQWGNARAEDLWAAFAESGDPELREMLRRFVEQPGIPELSFKRLEGDRIEVQQQRYRTIVGKDVAEQTWFVPIVLRYGGEGSEGTARLLLTKEREVFSAPRISRAEWIHPNAGESAYFTWNLPPEFAQALSKRASGSLTVTERLGILNAAEMAIASGKLEAGQWLQLLLDFSSDPDPEVKKKVVESLVEIHRTYASEDNFATYASMLRRTLRPMLEQIGFERRTGELPEWSLLRASLLLALGTKGNDPEVVAFCRKVAEQQLDDPRGVDADIALPALQVASWHGNAEWLERLKSAYEKASAADVRFRFLNGIAGFRDAKTLRGGLDYFLSDKVSATDFIIIIRLEREPETARTKFEWVRENYARLSKKISQDFRQMLPIVLAGGDQRLLEEGREFFLDEERKTVLTEVNFKKAAEAVELEAALRARHGAGMDEGVGGIARSKRE